MHVCCSILLLTTWLRSFTDTFTDPFFHKFLCMRKQCVPGSTFPPRNEPGHEAICMHDITTDSRYWFVNILWEFRKCSQKFSARVAWLYTSASPLVISFRHSVSYKHLEKKSQPAHKHSEKMNFVRLIAERSKANNRVLWAQQSQLAFIYIYICMYNISIYTYVRTYD